MTKQRQRLEEDLETTASLPVFADDEEIGGVEEIYAVNGEEMVGVLGFI